MVEAVEVEVQKIKVIFRVVEEAGEVDRLLQELSAKWEILEGSEGLEDRDLQLGVVEVMAPKMQDPPAEHQEVHPRLLHHLSLLVPILAEVAAEVEVD